MGEERGRVWGEEEVREALPGVWHPLLARFGRLTDVQRRAMVPIARGESVLVCAPTASGKTEAVVAPLVERLWGEGRQAKGEKGEKGERRTLVVVVSPTRALANDLVRRLEGLIGQRDDLKVGVRTGDQRRKAWVEGEVAQVLVTTPEALDAYLTRKPKDFLKLMAVALDELHLTQATGRGDQLRGLLQRLERISPKFQRCAMSATVADPAGLSARFLGEGASYVVAGGGKASRTLALTLREMRGLDDAARAAVGTLREGVRKVLVFVNRRQDAEALTVALRRLQPPVEGVLIHHGSLERSQRQQVEAQLLRLRSWVCVATMTLELGVDIGDIDQVVLVHPPPDTASLTQRVGRAKRRGGVIQALGLYESELERQRLLFAEAQSQAGIHFSESYPFRPWIVVQQALSMIYQFRDKKAIHAQALWSRLPPDAAARYTVQDCHAILQGAAAAGMLREVGQGCFVPEPLTDALFQSGQLHSTLENTPSLTVIDQLTGRALGTIDPRRLSPPSGLSASPSLPSAMPQHVQLGGHTQTILRLSRDALTVSPQRAPTEAPNLFAPRGSPICPPTEAAAFGAWLQHPPDTLRWTPTAPPPSLSSAPTLPSGAPLLLQHFLGTLQGHLLKKLLQHLHIQVLDGDPALCWWVTDSPQLRALLSSPPPDLPRTLSSILHNTPSLLDLLQPGPLSAASPPYLTHAWLSDAYNLPRLTSLLSSCPWTEAPPQPWMSL